MVVFLLAALMAIKPLAVAKQPAGPVTVEVRASDDIFAAGLGGGERLKRDMGTPPQAIAVTPGETLELNATGKVACCGVGQVKVDAAGFPRNPLGDGGVHIANPLHTRVSAFTDPSAAFMLLGVFDGDGFGSNDPFEIGRHRTVTVPPDATRLYFGFADAPGFNGPAGNYGDNRGTLTVTISRTR